MHICGCKWDCIYRIQQDTTYLLWRIAGAVYTKGRIPSIIPVVKGITSSYSGPKLDLHCPSKHHIDEDDDGETEVLNDAITFHPKLDPSSFPSIQGKVKNDQFDNHHLLQRCCYI